MRANEKVAAGPYDATIEGIAADGRCSSVVAAPGAWEIGRPATLGC